MTRNAFIGLMFLTSVGLFARFLAFAEDPTLHQVYEAADAGKLGEAQAMMDKVLRDHPGSAKAHFVEAELLAKQGRVAQARTELETAEHLSRGLSFATPQAVQHLRSRIAPTSLDNLGPSEGTMHNVAAPVRAGFPGAWSWSAQVLSRSSSWSRV